MLAIHNLFIIPVFKKQVANAYAKLSKCQQFTTQWRVEFTCVQLQTLMQSYQNVSNSQRYLLDKNKNISCKRLCKVIKMLAIHNGSETNELTIIVANAYAKLSKCQQFTTVYQSCYFISLLQTLMQSYQNVSNSQLMC